jgi:prepilin-type N-terminal cleavage/methylation domain-containing protein
MAPSGFSLIEVLVALGLVGGALLAHAGVIAVAARASMAARVQTVAVSLASSRMEELRALAFARRAQAPHDLRTDVTTDLARSPGTPGGTGLAPTSPGSLQTNEPGAVDYLDLDGRPVGQGAQPPPATFFIRRWRILPLPADPGEGLVLDVVVTTAGREQAAAGAAALLPVPVAVTAIRVRKSGRA